MLEFAVEAHVDLATATKIALGSMMSTAQANLSVGPPYDLGVYRNDSLTMDEFRITPDSALLRRLQGVWEKDLTMAVADLPTIQDLEEHGEAYPTDEAGGEPGAPEPEPTSLVGVNRAGAVSRHPSVINSGAIGTPDRLEGIAGIRVSTDSFCRAGRPGTGGP